MSNSSKTLPSAEKESDSISFLSSTDVALAILIPESKALISEIDVDVAMMDAHQFARYFVTACEEKNRERVQLCLSRLVKEGINKSLKEVSMQDGILKAPPLFIAVCCGFSAIIPELIKAGANPDTNGEILPVDRKAENIAVYSPIALATRILDVDSVKSLLEAKASTSHVYPLSGSNEIHTLFFELANSYNVPELKSENDSEKRVAIIRLFEKLKIPPVDDWRSRENNTLLIRAAENGDFLVGGVFLDYLEKYAVWINVHHIGEQFRKSVFDWLAWTKATSLEAAFDTYDLHQQESVVFAKFLKQFNSSLVGICSKDTTFANLMKTKTELMKVLFPLESEIFILLKRFAEDIFKNFVPKDNSSPDKITFFDKSFKGQVPVEVFITQLKTILEKMDKIHMRTFLLHPQQDEKKKQYQLNFPALKKEFLEYLKKFEESLRALGLKDEFLKLQAIKTGQVIDQTADSKKSFP